MRLGKPSILAIILFIGLFLTTIAVAGNLSQRFANPPPKTPTSIEITKLRVCPGKWYKNKQPCVYKDSPAECNRQRKEYFIIDGERKEVEDVDIEWVKENCEVKEPEVVY
ncbi:hypothetical protein HYU93_00440 [Candidatus Daviesbacteria bacterium]|nr:hypothetical protein [Candidatus Daviesbacteria bacterium]